MKRRVTYITASDAQFDPSKHAILSKDTLSIRGVDAAKEERFTFTASELPLNLSNSLQKTRELHVRWSSEQNFAPVAPFLARKSPGLHVYHISSSLENIPAGHATNEDQTCLLVQDMFGHDIQCALQDGSISQPQITKDSASFTTTQPSRFYHQVSSLDHFAQFTQHLLCNSTDGDCAKKLSPFSLADSMNIDYDSERGDLILSIFWSQPPPSTRRWTEDIIARASDGKLEVGILSNEKALDPEDLSLGGYLAVVGQDSKLTPTLFSFPSRHHVLPDQASYTSSFSVPTGLHPTMEITVSRSALVPPSAPEDTTCALFTYLTLPSTVFADKYQLSTKDPLFLSSHNLKGVRAVSGETDLEAPDWVIPTRGSNLLMEIATPDEEYGMKNSEHWNVTIPLHLRYLKPSASGHRSISVPWPTVFWACSAAQDQDIGINPFDEVNVGYDTLFPSRTFFYHLRPAKEKLLQEIHVPVLRTSTIADRLIGDAASQVEFGTVTVISLGFAWVVWKLVQGLWSGQRSTLEVKKKK